MAREGSLAATVKGNTDLKGGVIAALESSDGRNTASAAALDGKDSGKLTLSTATLTATDIKDSARSHPQK